VGGSVATEPHILLHNASDLQAEHCPADCGNVKRGAFDWMPLVVQVAILSGLPVAASGQQQVHERSRQSVCRIDIAVTGLAVSKGGERIFAAGV
jgi:hypothetical protein